MIEVLNISVLVLRKSSKSLFQAFTLILFFASIFILLGKQLYKGVLTQKCVSVHPPNISHLDYVVFVANTSNWLEDKNVYYLCGNGTGARRCPSDYVCLKGTEIDSFYASNFNFYGSSVVTISQLMTLHFWQELYQRMLLTVGSLHVTYFVLAFYMFLYLNGLILSIITRSYKVVIMELNASDKTATLVVQDNVNVSHRPKSIVKSPSCKSYELFVTQVKSIDRASVIEDRDLSQSTTPNVLQGCTTNSADSLGDSSRRSIKSSGSKNRPSFRKYFSLMRKKMQWLLLSRFSEGMFLVGIGVNSVLLSIRHFNMSPRMERVLAISYYVFAGLSALEVLLKMLAFGVRRYLSVSWNRIDLFFIVAASCEMAAFQKHGVLLILRILKLTKLLQRTFCLTCNYLASITTKVLSMYSHPGVVLAVFVTICIVSGMQMYGTEYFHSTDRFPDQESPRWFFRDCYNSFLLVFCMLCGDWKQPMVNAIFFTSYASNLLMLLFVLIGNLVVMNLFPGLVFYTLFYKVVTPFANTVDQIKSNAISKIFYKLRGKDIPASEVSIDGERKTDDLRIERPIATSVSQEIINKNMGKAFTSRGSQRSFGVQHQMSKEFEIIEDVPPPEYMADCCPSLLCCAICKPDKNPVIWQAWADLRCWLYCQVEKKLFRIFIDTIIIISVVILIVDRTYTEDYPVAVRIVKILEPTVIVLFILEMFLKWTAYGLQKYFKSPLGRLEFVVILVYMADLLTIEFFDGQKNVFRSLRAFRLLSVIQLLSSYQEVPPLPLKRNACSMGSENASRESLLHLKRVECDHFLNRYCRQGPVVTQRVFAQETILTDWKRSTVYTPDSGEKSTEKHVSKKKTSKETSPPVVETVDCLPSFCYRISPCCYCCFNENSLILNKWKKVRECATCLVNGKCFFIFSICVIILSSLFLVADILWLERPVILVSIAFYADKVVASLFLLMMLLKWLALGWKAYFTSIWCWLEFVVTTTSLLYVALDESGIACIPLLRIVRIFFMLYLCKALGFNKQSKMLLKSLGVAIPAYVVAILLCLFFWLVHAVIGVYLFNGMFHYCSFGSGDEKIPIHKNIFPYDSENNCLMVNGTHMLSTVNFDNIGSAYIALLQVATLQNWLSLVTEIMDNCQLTEHLKYQFYTSLYFPSFIMISTFLTLNFFTGITLYYFAKFKKDSKIKYGNETQKLYQAAMKKMKTIKLQKPIPEPMLPLQKLVYRMVNSDNFEIAGFVFIGLHMLLIALDMYDPYPSEMFDLAMTELNVFFLVLFSVESILKLFALRQYFFIKLWNIFDVTVLTLCILGALFEDEIFISPMVPAMLRILRFIKAPRYLRRHARGVLPLIATLQRSIPTTISICLLQFMVMTIYTVLGVYMFKDVKHKWDVSGELNFASFSQSMLLLFQLSTLSGWKDVLNSLAEGTMCSNTNLSECYNWELATMYIISYLFIMYYIIVKTHLVIVLENFECSMEEFENILLTEDYQMFAEIWQKFDVNATGIMKFNKLSDLFDVMEEPFHFDKPNRFLIVSLNVPIYEGELVFYGDVMDALTRDFMAQNGHAMDLPQNLPMLLDKNGRKLKKISSSLWRQRQNHCAHVIQSAWKRYAGTLPHKPCPVFFSEVRLASHSEKVDTYLTSSDRFSSHASV